MPSQLILPLTRRAFVRGGSLWLLAAKATQALASAESKPNVRVGVITDLHYADKPTRGTRHYRDTLTKLGEAAEYFAKAKPNFVVELGDFIDAADSVEVELGYLRRVNEVFAAIPGPKHYVLGNHCVDTLTKPEFLDGIGRKEAYYSFDSGGVHFVVLDSCFTADGRPYGRKSSKWTDANIPADELDWLRSDLRGSHLPTIVLAHQRLDDGKSHAVQNAVEVRKILENSGRVLAVLQGHSHKNSHQEIAGIHYVTLVAMVEGPAPKNNGFAMLEVGADGTLRIDGFRDQANYAWS
jgi:alkaline phosphatase